MQCDRGPDSIKCYRQQGHVRGHYSSDEAGDADTEACQHVESDDCGSVADKEVDEEGRKRRHFLTRNQIRQVRKSHDQEGGGPYGRLGPRFQGPGV